MESRRELPRELMEKSRLFYPADRKQKSMQFAKVHDHCMETCETSECMDDIWDLVEFTVGTNTLVANSIIDFHKFLSGLCDCCKLFNERSLDDGNRKIHLSDPVGAFFSVRKGNEWGSIYCTEEDISLCEAKQRYTRQLQLINDAGWSLDRLMPPAKMAEHLLRTCSIRQVMPSLSDGSIDDIHVEMAYNAFRGSRMEAAAVGRFKGVSSVDFNSAFLSVMRDLPSIHPRFVKWIESKEYQGEAIMGFVECHTYIPENSPLGILATRVDIPGGISRLFFSVGDSVGWRTKDEIDLLLSTGYGDIEIYRGSWAMPLRDSPKPFSEMSNILEDLMYDDITRGIAKFIAATSWGKFISMYSTNKLWNPFYASEITAKIRTRLTKMAMLNYSDLIAITVDGMELSRSFDAENFSGEQVGGIKVRKRGEILSLTDYYRYDSSEKYNWELGKKGVVIRLRKNLPFVIRFGGNIGEDLTPIVIPYGSSKRMGPSRLNLKTIEDGVYKMKPPTPEECTILYFSRQESAPYELDL